MDIPLLSEEFDCQGVLEGDHDILQLAVGATVSEELLDAILAHETEHDGTRAFWLRACVRGGTCLWGLGVIFAQRCVHGVVALQVEVTLALLIAHALFTQGRHLVEGALRIADDSGLPKGREFRIINFLIRRRAWQLGSAGSCCFGAVQMGRVVFIRRHVGPTWPFWARSHKYPTLRWRYRYPTLRWRYRRR